MKLNIFLFAFLALSYVGCKDNSNPVDHSHESAIENDSHDHSESNAKVHYTAYSNNFEVFAVVDPFVIGHKSNISVYLTKLTDYKPSDAKSMTIKLVVFGKETIQTITNVTKSGKYNFNIVPKNLGVGELQFDINTKSDSYKIVIPKVKVFADEHDAIHFAEELTIETPNAIPFSKEQSWKIDFASNLPKVDSMGQVIKTTAQINSAPNDEILVTSATNGVVLLSDYGILEGKEVTKGQLLFSVSGSNLMDDNSEVRFIEAKNNFELASSQYQRQKELAKDKIISEKELQISKNKYENAKVNFNNIKNNFDSSGQSVYSPVDGYVKLLLAKNGQYVEVGQPVVSISQNRSLFLHADVQQKYHAILDNINSATIHTLYDNKIYTLDNLNGKIISYGRSTNNHNFLIPINLEIDYIQGFMPGSFVELYLRTNSENEVITIPKTAILENHGNFFVVVQINPELFEMREVKLGVTDGIRTEITEGITNKERIVTKGAVHIKLARGTGALDAHSGHVH